MSEPDHEVVQPRWMRTIWPWSLAFLVLLWTGAIGTVRDGLGIALLIFLTISWLLPLTERVVVDEHGISSRRWWTKRTFTPWDEVEEIRGARVLESIHLVLPDGRRQPLFSHRADADDVVARLRDAGRRFGWTARSPGGPTHAP